MKREEIEKMAKDMESLGYELIAIEKFLWTAGDGYGIRNAWKLKITRPIKAKEGDDAKKNLC